MAITLSEIRPDWRVACGYQEIFVPLTALSSPRYGPMDGQPVVYLYIAALEVKALNRRESGDDGDQLSLLIQARMSSSRRFVSWPSRRTAGSW